MTSSSNPTVSIVMATYNASQFIADAIQSLVNQTYSNFEVVIIDDGSTDDTHLVVMPFLKDARINYIQQENGGQTVAKNRGITESSGSLIAFCDSDDYWHPQKLEKQLPLLMNYPDVGVVYSDIQSIDEHGKIVKDGQTLKGPQGNILNKLLFENPIPFGTAIIRRTCIDEHGGFNEKYKMGIDWDLWLRISTSWRFAFVPEKLYFYREWSGQMSRNYEGRYTAAHVILRNFQSKHTKLVDKLVFRRALSDIHANHAYHVSLYEGYTKSFFILCAKALFFGYDRPSTIKRVARAILRRF